MTLETLPCSIRITDSGKLLGMMAWDKLDDHIEVTTIHATEPSILLRLMVEFRRLHAPAKVCYETGSNNLPMMRLGLLLGAKKVDGRYWFALCRGGRDTLETRQET